MACRSVVRSAILIEPILLRPSNFNSDQYLIAPRFKCKINNLRRTITSRPARPPPSCSHNETPSSHADQDPPQDTVLKAISEVSKAEGRVGQTTNMVIGGTVADDSTDEWRDLDQKVNLYPMVRGFTAIGTGGADFVQAMVIAVESVIQQPIPQEHVKQKLSSGGKYVSVNIGPIQVVSSEQVQAVYNAMRRDDRMKYFL